MAAIGDSEIANALVNVPEGLLFQGDQKKLTMKQLDELISYSNPPQAVITVLEALCAAIGYDNVKRNDWPTVKKILDASRKEGHLKLIGVQAEDIPEDAWKKIQRACAIEQSKIKQASLAAASTATFLRGLLATKPAREQSLEAENPLVDNSPEEKAPTAPEDKGDDWSTISEPAIRLVKGLDRRTLNELKSYRAPPHWVRECLSGIICCLFGKPESWENARKLLTNVACVQRLLNFNPYSVDRLVLKRLQTLCAHPSLKDENMKQNSIAAEAFVSFAHTLVEFRCAPRPIPESQRFRHLRSRMTMYGALIPLKTG